MYVLLIKRDKCNGASILDIEKTLKTHFRNYDHMEGFIEGYCFGNGEILTLREFETKINNQKTLLDNYFIKFLTVKEVEADYSYQ